MPDTENRLVVAKRRGGGGMDREFGISIDKLVYIGINKQHIQEQVLAEKNKAENRSKTLKTEIIDKNYRTVVFF